MSFLSGGLSAVIGGVGELVSLPLQNYYNKKAASRENQYSWDMLKYQNDWNLEQWNRENEYNSPKNIMARYQEANLNPNLIYQNSYESPAHLESASGSTPRVQPPKVDLLSGMLRLYNMELQNNLLDQQIQQIKAQTAQIKSNTQNSNNKNDWEEMKRQFERDTGFAWDSWSGKAYRAGQSVGKYISDVFDGRSNESFERRMVRNAKELQSMSRFIKKDPEGRAYVEDYNFKTKKFDKKYLTPIEKFGMVYEYDHR